MASSVIAMLHVDDGYSRHGNFDGSLVHSMFSMYLPDGTPTSTVEGIGSVYVVESCKIVFVRGTYYSLVQTLVM